MGSGKLNKLEHRCASPQDLTEFEAWLVERALEHDQPTFLLHTATERLHWERIVRPGLTSLERIISAARERARTVTYERLSHLLSSPGKEFLDDLLELRTEESNSISRTKLSWLQRLPNDHTPSQLLATLDKIRFLQEAGVPNWDLSTLNPNRLKSLADLGARATNQQLQRTSALRRYPILVAFLKQTLFDLTDAVIDLFDAYLWQQHSEAKKALDAMRLKAARSTNEKLRIYSEMAKIVVDSGVPDAAVRTTVFACFQMDHLTP